MQTLFRIASALLLLFVCAGAGAAEWTAEDFEPLSGPASPQVEMALQRAGSTLEIAFNIQNDGTGNKIQLGVSAAKTLIVSEADATKNEHDGATQFVFSIPENKLVAAEGDWERLRVGVAVAWTGGALGQDRQRERFRHSGFGAPHAGLSPSESDWLPLNLAEHALAVADRKNKIHIGFNQPVDGKATLVIEDEKGNRIRNLVSGLPFAKGPQRVEWDGQDDHGNVVAPGAYRWRSIHHSGIKPNYLFSFCNDGSPPWRTGSGTDMWGPDHSILLTAAAGKDWTFLGGSVAESGYAMVAVDATGAKRMQYNPASGTGIEKVCLACDEQYLYAAHDGFIWGQHIDKKKPDWKGTQKISITRFNIKNGSIAEFPKNKKFTVVASTEIGPGSVLKNSEKTSLQGLALLAGKLYVSDFYANQLLIVDAASGEKTGELKLDAPGALAASGTSLLAISGGRIVRVNPVSGENSVLIAAETISAEGLTADTAGNIYVSDGKRNTVRVFDASGKALKEIGTPGGAYAGPYDPQRMINPRALAVAGNGWLWVCEERWNPKRASAWDCASGKIVKEKWGPTAYGACGGGFDPEDPSRWIGQGALWNVDLAQQTSKCAAILKAETGERMDPLMHYSFYHQDGRTFIIGMGMVLSLSELKPDGSLKDLAMLSSAHRFCYWQHWDPPQVFIDAFERAYPKLKGKVSEKGPGFLWIDRNGDGRMQSDEIEFSTASENFAGSSWGHDQHDLTLRVPATVKGKRVIVSLKPDGYLPGGAPNYPPLNDAIAAAVPIDMYGNEIETSIDRFGNMVFNSDPEMKCFGPDGKLRWTFPNRWTNVHGSHNAPLPEPGVTQGTLFFLGMAPLDEKADVFVMNGNHGRFFVLTSDGLYLDEMFKDVRMGGSLDAYLIGGECFGGFFGKSKDGNFYLQSGHCDYRIFHLDGLAQVTRDGGSLNVGPAQIVAAERHLAKQIVQKAAKKEAGVSWLKTPPPITAKESDWPGAPSLQWEKNGQFPVSVRLGYDAQKLYLFYKVADSSPWVNNGNDSTLLFKTGDSIDLQLSTDAEANPMRSVPVPGDERLLIAPFQGQNIAVLYRHRTKGAKDNPVTFTCPWRSETVDSVKVLDKAQIAVRKENGGYCVEAAIPLSDLGLANPAGKTIKADCGVIYGDPDGAIDMLRSYWANQNTGLVNDVPGEIMLSPNMWGTFKFSGDQP